MIGRTTGFQDSGTEAFITLEQTLPTFGTRFYMTGTGFPWTTGMVTVYGTTGYWATFIWTGSRTVARRSGYDNRTPMGLGRIQLVSPQIAHWSRPHGDFNSADTAVIAILNISVPEPSELLLLGAGLGVLVLLHRVAAVGE